MQDLIRCRRNGIKRRTDGGRVLVVDSPVLDYTDVGQETKVDQIKEEIQRGAYQVDPKAVADAMLRRLFGVTVGAAVKPGSPAPRYQNECS
jgi:Anti-sigma-28 factor, FlgM